MSKTAHCKATSLVNKIDNAIGKKNICCMWYDYFNKYNSVSDKLQRQKGAFVDACCAIRALYVLLSMRLKIQLLD